MVLAEPPAVDGNYTASTPANTYVRHFLGINQHDSVDFIRWKLKITDHKEFALTCTYGIGKPGTNGFINEKGQNVRALYALGMAYVH